MSDNKVNISGEQINYNDNNVLDALKLNPQQKKAGTIKSIIFTIIAIIVFFVPVTINGNTDIVFGTIYKTIKSVLGLVGIWMICSIIIVNGPLSIYSKFICKNKESKLYKYYEDDSIVHAIFYLLGSAFAVVYVLDQTFAAFSGPEWLVGTHTGGTVFPVAIDVAWIIPVSAFFMPFLLNYGIVDLIGSLMEPLMRPVFKVPGRSAVNAIASFVSSSSVGVLITSKLYRSGVYTKKEACIIVTGFSAVSVGFAYMAIETAGLAEHFLLVYFLALLITLIISFFMARIPPLSTKESVFIDGRKQTKEDIQRERHSDEGALKKGVERAIKKAYTAPNLFTEIKSSLKDGYFVLPKVISLLAAVGTVAMIVANYTPVFNWIGKVFEPLLMLLQVPNAAEIAPSFPVGIAEMFLPVMMIADKVEMLAAGARYMVVTVAMVQIIFFSETIVVMLSTKMPISLKELIICFVERTLIAIPVTAVFMHILF